MKKVVLYGNDKDTFYKVNCYFIEDNKECYIIDPGFEREKIIKYLTENELKAKGILLTHAHIDHIGEIGILDLPVYLHEKEYEILSDDEKNGYIRWDRVNPYKLDKMNIVKVNEDTLLKVGNKTIEIIYTPGHTVGGTCYKEGKNLYTGDTLFRETVGIWKFPTGNKEDMKMSIIKLIDNIDEDVNVYPAHGRSSTIGHEKYNNPYYLKWKHNIK